MGKVIATSTPQTNSVPELAEADDLDVKALLCSHPNCYSLIFQIGFEFYVFGLSAVGLITEHRSYAGLQAKHPLSFLSDYTCGSAHRLLYK